MYVAQRTFLQACQPDSFFMDTACTACVRHILYRLNPAVNKQPLTAWQIQLQNCYRQKPRLPSSLFFFKPRRNLCESQCNFHLSCRVQRLCHTTRCCTYRDLHKTLIVWNCLLDETAVFVNQSTLAGSAIPSCIQSRPTPPCSFPHPHPAPTPQTHQTCSFLVSSESFCQQLVPPLFQPTIYVKLISTSTTTA